MKKIPTFLLLFGSLCLCSFSMVGCGDKSNQVIEAPPADEDPTMGDVDEDEYNRAMNQSLGPDGN
ncbi:MAG: hypothetical protein MI861_17795 [Pirellulales bacterium]|nr:hypothetical protein [Pirellulales bacterium]